MSSSSTAGSDTSQLRALEKLLEHLQIEQPEQQPQVFLDTTSWTFENMEPRRSARLTVYDSNGRDALAGYLGMSRPQLEAFLTSSTVRPHLQFWYRLCVEGERRFNDAIDWINTGKSGYFYNPADLEEDLLLECLGEGMGTDVEDKKKSFAAEGAKTGDWITQDVWARTIWRIVQYNFEPGQIFNNSITVHPAACYGFGIDLLTIAFHSICHRKAGSCWHDLIIGASHYEKDAWTTGRYSWLADHGKDDAQNDSAKSDAMDLDESESSDLELGGDVTTIVSDSSVADPDNNAPRTMAALREQRYNIAEAKIEAIARSTQRQKPLTLDALQEPEHLPSLDDASEAMSITQWRKKVDDGTLSKLHNSHCPPAK